MLGRYLNWLDFILLKQQVEYLLDVLQNCVSFSDLLLVDLACKYAQEEHELDESEMAHSSLIVLKRLHPTA